MKKLIQGILISLLTTSAQLSVKAVILYGTGDPGQDVSNMNTTAPTGVYANSGWAWQGKFGIFSGTAISSDKFITAKHIECDSGNRLFLTPDLQPTANTKFILNGITYVVTAKYRHPDPAVDLTIWKVSGNFPSHANLYLRTTHPDFLSPDQEFVVYGRGGPRGAPVLATASGALRGWLWTAPSADEKIRWGTTRNIEPTVLVPPSCPPPPNGGSRQGLAASFWPNDANSFALSYGDSGGGLYTRDPDGSWSLAGIVNSVSGSQWAQVGDNNTFFAAIFDAAGLAQFYSGTYPTFVTRSRSNFVLLGSDPTISAWILKELGRTRIVSHDVLLPGGNVFGFKLGGSFTGTITIQKSDDLASWTSLASIPAPAEGLPAEFKDTGVGSVTARFYRAFDSANHKTENAVGFYRTPVGNSTSTAQWNKIIGIQLIPMLPPEIRFKTDSTGGADWSLPEGSAVAKYNPGSGWRISYRSLGEDVLGDPALVWTDETLQLNYGDGVYVMLPAGTTGSIAITGEVPQSYQTTITPGWNRLVCLPIYKNGSMSTPFGYSPAVGDITRRMTNPNGTLTDSTFTSSSVWSPSASLNGGYGFWYFSNRPNPTTWNFTYSLWP